MRALLIIDLQNDFCPGGALAVPGGDEIVPVVNRLAQAPMPIVLTQDWHPANHLSFAAEHAGKEPFSTVEMPYGTQTLWPTHCVQGTTGADFHPDLDRQRGEVIIRKGFRREIDSYSAFRENDGQVRTGLEGYLRERGIDHLVMTGLATDFCVLWSVEDARRSGFSVTVIEDACRGIDIDGSVAAAWDRIRAAGATVTTAEEWLREHAA